jgi:FkbM family methyltransferase
VETKQLKIKVNGHDHVISFRTDTSDIRVIKQIFEEQQYNINRLHRAADIRDEYERIQAQGKVPVILDLGANIGASSLYFHWIWPEAKVIAVEPAKDNFDLLLENTKAYKNMLPIHAAAASTDGFSSIINDGAEKWAYRTEINAAPDGTDLAARSVQSLMAATENALPFICKIDIEGAESELFSANTDWAATFPLLAIELHDWMLPKQGASKNFQQVHAKLDRDIILVGENLFSISNQI